MRKVTQRITALALASAVAFSVLPTAAFAEASLDAASTAVQAEAEPESQPVPEQASSDAFVEAASSEAASSEAASSEAASSEAASSEAASSEAASSEAASSEITADQPLKTASLLNTLANHEYTMNLDEGGETTQKAIYDTLGGSYFGGPMDTFKIDDTTQIGFWNGVHFHDSITLDAGEHKVTKLSGVKWKFYGTLTVVLVDNRAEITMDIDKDYTVKYKAGEAGHKEMDDFVAQQRTQHVDIKGPDGNLLPDGEDFIADNFEFEYKHAAGEQELTVTFKGSKKYKPATATGKILVTKGDAAVTVHSQTIQYGERFVAPIFTADPTEAGVVGLIGGVKADGGLFVGIDGNITLNQLLGTDNPIGNIPLKTLLPGQDEIKLGQLTKVLENLLKGSDYLPSGDLKTALETIQKAIDALTAAVPGISDAVISLNYPTEAGIYTAVGFTTSQNYETAIGVGSLVIKQACATVKVNSQVIKHGGTLEPVFSCTPPEANGVGIIAGLNTSGGYYVGVKFCNPKMQEHVNGKTTLKDLASVLENVPDADTTGLNSAVSVLNKIMPGIENTVITFDDPVDAGIYTAVGFTTNKNYQVAPVFGSIVIGQDCVSKKLVFNQELPASKTLAVSEAKAFNFGGHLENVSRALPTIGVNASYVGVKSNGRPYAGSTPCLEPGCYTETVYLLGTNYTACPISRCYTIINDQIEIRPVDSKFYGDNDPESFAFEVRINYTEDNTAFVKPTTELQNALANALTIEREPGEDAGTYKLSIKYDESKLPEGYTYRFSEGTFTILPRQLALEIDDIKTIYGNDIPAVSYRFYDYTVVDSEGKSPVYDMSEEALPGFGFVFTDKDGQTVEPSKTLPAGTYYIAPTGLDSNANYFIGFATAELNICPRSVYLQVKDASMTEGESFPAVEFSFFEAGEKGEKLDAVADWMSDELANTKIAVAYADAAQGPKLSAGQYDMSFDQIAFADAAAASNAKVTMSVTGLYDNTNYDVNLFTLNEEHTKLATLTVNKKPSSGGHHSSSSSNKASDSNNNAAEEQSAVQQITAVQPASVQTGDNSSLLLNLAILLASVLGLVVILRKKI